MQPSDKLKALEGYIALVARSNDWFDQKQDVRLTHQQVRTLIKHAYCAGLDKGLGNNASLFEQLFGKIV